MLLAAHVARAHTLTEWMDASILDESHPEKRDPQLNLYDPMNPNQPPIRSRISITIGAPQVERNRRITAWVKDKLESLRAEGHVNAEFSFVVHGTMADPRWLDSSVDPNGRRQVGAFWVSPAWSTTDRSV